MRSERTDEDVNPELVVMVGLQGCGKSTWVARHLAGTHAVVSKDNWPNARHREARQRSLVDALLLAGRSVVVDNTNPSPRDRAPLIRIGQVRSAHIRAVFVDVPLPLCVARNAARTGRAQVPLAGMLATRRRLVPPSTAEGFERVHVVQGRGEPRRDGPPPPYHVT